MGRGRPGAGAAMSVAARVGSARWRSLAAGVAAWWRERQGGERLARLAAYGAVAAVAYVVAELSWALLPAVEEAQLPELPVTAAKVAAPVGGGVEELAGRHLFGRADEAAAPPPPPQVKAPETRLNLTLRGLLASSSPAGGGAIIAAAGGEEKFYPVGKELPGGATLKEVRSDEVLLVRGGRLETLRLPKESLPGGAAPLPLPVTPMLPDAVEEGETAPPAAAEGTMQLGDLLRATPMMVAGQLKGFRIYPGRNRDLFARSGLRPGDVVSEVAGQRLDDPAAGLQTLTETALNGPLPLKLERGGREESVVIQLP